MPIGTGFRVLMKPLNFFLHFCGSFFCPIQMLVRTGKVPTHLEYKLLSFCCADGFALPTQGQLCRHLYTENNH